MRRTLHTGILERNFMMADVSVQNAKYLSELRVIDLKQELENRGLDKTGVKAQLLDRLKKALEDEGKDPSVFRFEISIKKMSDNEIGDTEGAVEDAIDLGDFGEAEILDECGEMNGTDEVSLVSKEEEERLLKEAENKLNEVGEPNKSVEVKKEETEPVKDEIKTEAVPEVKEEDEIKEEMKSEVKEETSTDEIKQEPQVSSEPKEVKEEIKAEPETSESSVPVINIDDDSVKSETPMDDENKENALAPDFLDQFPPTPTSVKPVVEFTSADTVNMDTSGDRKEDDISLIVHVDETMNEFDDTISNASGTSFSTSTRAQTPVSATPRDGGEEVETTEKSEANVEMKDVTEDKESADEPQKVEDAEKSGGATDDNKMSESTDKKQSTDNAAATDKETSKKEEEKKDDKSKSSTSSRNLWISGLSASTRATDLKTLFSKYGKVAGAKVVTNARSPMSRCYGFVTMNTADEASKCIQHLHRTELHGRMISVERAKADPSQAKPSTTKKPDDKKDEKAVDKHGDKKAADRDHRRRATTGSERHRYHERGYRRTNSSHGPRTRHSSSHRSRSRDRKRSHGDGKSKTTPKKEDSKKHTDEKKDENAEKKEGDDNKEAEKVETTEGEEKKTDASTGEESKEGEKTEDGKEAKTEEKKDDKKKDDKKDEKKSEERRRDDRKGKDKEMLSLEKIKEERERERLRMRERRIREEERRRREMLERDRMRQRDMAARQREESVKLQRERERLRLERERLEREKLETERERIRLEREKRERERQEIAEQRRQEALRYEERQRVMKRPYDRQGPEDYWGEPKRAAYDQPPRYNNFDEREQQRGGAARPGVYEREPGYSERQRERAYDRVRDAPGARFEERREDRERRDRDDRHAGGDRYRYDAERGRRDQTTRDHAPREHGRHEGRRGSPHRPAREPSPRRDKPRDSHRDNRPGAERTYSGSGARGEGSWQSPPARRSHDKEPTQYTRGGAPGASANQNSGLMGEGPPSSSASWVEKNRVVVPAPTARPGAQWVSPAVQPRLISQPVQLQPQHPAAGHTQFMISAANIISAGLGAGLTQANKPSDAARYGAYSAQRRY